VKEESIDLRELLLVFLGGKWGTINDNVVVVVVESCSSGGGGGMTRLEDQLIPSGERYMNGTAESRDSTSEYD
jgi:hypothetical protein